MEGLGTVGKTMRKIGMCLWNRYGYYSTISWSKSYKTSELANVCIRWRGHEAPKKRYME
jgi:hypothetical protein